MVEGLLVIVLILVIVAVVLLSIILKRGSKDDLLQLESHIVSFERNQERTERTLKEEVALNREETSKSSRNLREEMINTMTKISNVQQEQFDSFSKKLDTLTQSNEQKLDKMRETVEGRLKLLQDDNTKKLDQMRETVDEKLHATLEKRLGESFKQVSDRLEKVHQGLGEMQTLAAGVGDLKKVLTNVKTRGTWGEIQLGALLEQVLSGEQYEKNVATKKGSNDRVEFAIKLPGHDDKDDQPVWLPIDAKFPREDYERLVEAQEKADAGLAEDAAKQLEVRIKSSAKEIKDKYLDPPHTTDFGIMFLPTEGLFAEVIKRPGLSDFLQREYRISVTGPTTLAALLNSLQMGFRTLTIEKRSSEVWSLLGAVKTEFGKFGTILDKTQKKLQEASNTIEDAAKKSRTIERKLKNVQELPAQESLLNIPVEISDNDEAENDGVIT